MTIDIALVVVALGSIVFAAWRVMARRPAAVPEEAPPVIPPRRRPSQYALPPVTIETLPPKFAPDMVPPIDHRLFAALVASGARTAEVTRPQQLARGSIAEGCGYVAPPRPDAAELETQTFTSPSDLDGAETLTPASDLDEDAETRSTMPPVR